METKGYHFLYALRDTTHEKTYLGRCFFVAVLWEPEVCTKETFLADSCCSTANCFTNSRSTSICTPMSPTD